MCKDIIISKITKLKNQLKYVFEIRDLGKLKYFLRIEVSYSASCISFTQQKYTINLLEDTIENLYLLQLIKTINLQKRKLNVLIQKHIKD